MPLPTLIRFGPLSMIAYISRTLESMAKQINPDTGLISSFEGLPPKDPSHGITWMFNQAQSIDMFLAAGDITHAMELADGALALQMAVGSWQNAYITATGKPATNLEEQQRQTVGDNVSLAKSLLNLTNRTDNIKYRDAAERLLPWLDQFWHTREDGSGYLSGGFDSNGNKLPWTSTENNLRAMAYYSRLGSTEKANQLAKWIQSMRGHSYYYAGYITDTIVNPDLNKATDVQFLAVVMALEAGLNPQHFEFGMDWLLKQQTHVLLNGNNLIGIPRHLDAGGIWVEGTTGTIAALQILGRDKDAELFLLTLQLLQDPSSGAFPAAIGGTPGWPGTFPYSSPEASGPVVVASLDQLTLLTEAPPNSQKGSTPLLVLLNRFIGDVWNSKVWDIFTVSTVYASSSVEDYNKNHRQAAKKSIQVAQKMLSDTDSEVRQAAMQALIDINTPESWEVFIQHVSKEKDYSLHAWIIEQIHLIQNPTILKGLRTMLKEKNFDALDYYDILLALAHQGDSDIIAPLIEMFILSSDEKETAHEVRRLFVTVAFEVLVKKAPRNLQKVIDKLSQIKTKTLTPTQQKELRDLMSRICKKLPNNFEFASIPNYFTPPANPSAVNSVQQAA